MTTRTRILDAILGVLPGARPDARITVEQPQQGGRDTWTGMAAAFADRIADAIEEGKDTRPGESTPTVSVRDVRTTVLVALSRALREQPTGARVLGGLEELGEAVVSADLGEIAAWTDALASLAHIDDALGSAAAQPLTVYRAEHETIPLGTYAAEGAARAHAESALSAEHGPDRTVMYDWIGDENDPEAPRELVAQVDGGDEQYTGYIVVPVPVAARFDPAAHADGEAY
ncbi:hypothetical protein AB0L68_36380 [Streptomyces sp. NPDC052164]|uniref:hypothetical protein n=1 Tax=Streptomyces sp. NPDC052164 TaxID=3155529 RepID=UPI0034206F3A